MYGGWGGVGDWEGVSDGGEGLKFELGTFRGFLIFFFKTSKFDSKSPLVIVKLGVDFRKTVLPAQILNFFSGPPTSPNF